MKSRLVIIRNTILSACLILLGVFCCFKFVLSYQGDNDDHALYCAAMKGELNSVKLLVERGADVNAEDNSGKTILDYVEFDDDFMVYRWLKEHGAQKSKR